jgi:hypothetical protein
MEPIKMDLTAKRSPQAFIANGGQEARRYVCNWWTVHRWSNAGTSRGPEQEKPERGRVDIAAHQVGSERHYPSIVQDEQRLRKPRKGPPKASKRLNVTHSFADKVGIEGRDGGAAETN